MGGSSFFDRAGKAIIFMLFGAIVLLLNFLVDIVWFLIHTYKKDLDKTVTKTKGKDVDALPEINRRTYKKIHEYFEKQNDQLVLQKQIAEDLRSFMDVDEGIRCMIYGKPIKIKEDKADFYIAYMHQDLEPKTQEHQLDSQQDIHDEKVTPGESEVLDDETFFMVERVVQEYNTIKQVLINNAIPVDVSHIASGGKHKG